jgi:hypothetical protein
MYDVDYVSEEGYVELVTQEYDVDLEKIHRAKCSIVHCDSKSIILGEAEFSLRYIWLELCMNSTLGPQHLTNGDPRRDLCILARPMRFLCITPRR